MHIWHYDSLDGNLSLKLTIFMFFCSYDPLSEGYCTPWNITFGQNSYIISFRRSQSICLGNILAFRCNKGGASGPFLKKCQKRAILGHFVRVQHPYKISQNQTSRSPAMFPHFPNLKPRFFWITVMPYVLLKKKFVVPPLAEKLQHQISVWLRPHKINDSRSEMYW